MDTILSEIQLWFAQQNEAIQWLVLISSATILVLVSNLIISKIVLRIISNIIKKTKTTWDNILQSTGFFNILARLPIIVIILLFLPLLIDNPEVLELVNRIIFALLIVLITRLVGKFIQSALQIYQHSPISKSYPIKGYVQTAQVLVIAIGIILAITTIAGVSPIAFLSGLGAMSAILLLVFKDSILGLISAIQLSVNKQVQIGDWIEVPQFGADGDVIDITLQSVLVQNWDKSIVTLPTYALTTSGFRNWRGMIDSGGRRIKRSIVIDVHSIRFLSSEDHAELAQIPLLTSYMSEQLAEIQKHNSSNPLLKRRLTNLGTFRAYISQYLRHHPQIHNSESMTFLVRQHPPSATGIAIELYVFSKDQVWAHYEDIQSDIFDHLLAMLPSFGLRAFQHLSAQLTVENN